MRDFFHVHVGDGESQEDHAGGVFPNDDLAIAEARKFVHEIKMEAAEIGSSLKYDVEVTNAVGLSVVRLDGQVKKAS